MPSQVFAVINQKILLSAGQTVNASKQFFDIVLLLLVFVAILWIAQWVSKKIAGMQIGQQRGQAMKVKEAIYVSPNKMLQIIQVGERYFLIAVYKEGIRFLTELQAEDIKVPEGIEPTPTSPFSDYLSKLKEKVGRKDEK